MNVELLDAEPSTALTVESRAALALNASQTEQDLKALAIKNVGIVAIIDKPGRDQAHGAAMELKRARTTIEKASKEAREDATKFSKAVIAESARLIGIVEPEEVRLIGLRDEWDNVQELIKLEKERVEKARITTIHERIAEIRGYHALALECRTAERIQSLMVRVAALWVALNPEEVFQEFADEALAVYDATYDRMTELHAQKFADEAERARIKAEQEEAAAALKAEREAFAAQQEAARIAAKNEQDLRDAEYAKFAAERDKAQAELRAAQDKIAADKAAIEAIDREAKEAAELAEYQKAIATPPIAPPEGVVVTVVEPVIPSAHELIWAVARAFNVHSGQAAEWLTDRMDEISKFE